MENIEGLTLYTGSNGKKGCTCNCIGCSQGKYGREHSNYQGCIKQVKDILKIAPNIKKAIILGNPDISVDPEFVNEVASLLVSEKIKVRFSTSGYNALDTARIVLNEVDTNHIEYYSFSIDSIDEKNSLLLRGNKIDFEDVKAAIKFCQVRGVQVKVQPTLWECNKNDYKDIIDYFSELDVKWFSFHCGSMETFSKEKDLLQHIKPWEWRRILEDISQICKIRNLKLHMPYLFLTNDEMNTYVQNNTMHCQPRNLKNTQIWIEDSYLRTTHCPLLREVQNFEYDLYSGDRECMDFSFCKDGYCPATAKCLGERLVKLSTDGKGHKFLSPSNIELNTVCRFYNLNI